MKFWAIDSPVMRVLGRLGDIIILNMIFVVGCIPVITIGTSLSALYAVAMKMARGEDPSVWKEFWKEDRLLPCCSAALICHDRCDNINQLCQTCNLYSVCMF